MDPSWRSITHNALRRGTATWAAHCLGRGQLLRQPDVFGKSGPSRQRVLDIPAHKASAEAAASEGEFRSLPVFFCNFLFMFQVSHLLPVPSDVGAKILNLFVVWFDF